MDFKEEVLNTTSRNRQTRWPGEVSDPRALADAYARIDKAGTALEALEAEVGGLVRQTVQLMVGDQTPDKGFHVGLPPAHLMHEGKLPTEVRQLCADIVENLRAALDYGIMAVVRKANPELAPKEEQKVSFPIARDKETFAKHRLFSLKCIGEDLKHSLEQIQPYRGNQILDFLRDESNCSKHRHLPRAMHAMNLEIELREQPAGNDWEEQGWIVIPADPGHVFRARARGPVVILHERYDALEVFPICIEHVQGITDSLERCGQLGQLPAQVGGHRQSGS